MLAGTSAAMANVTLKFANSNPSRVFSGSGDSIKLDFSIDGSGVVSLVATPVGSGTDREYLAAANLWTGNVGTVNDVALFHERFQITISVTTVNRINSSISGTERVSLDGQYGDGIMGIGGGNGGRIDWTTGPQEYLHFQQTGGSAKINLLGFEYHGASTSTGLWDTQLIAGSVSNRWDNLPGTTGFVDVSALGYVIGSGINDLTFSMPLDGTHGIGLAGMTLQIVRPQVLATTFDSSSGNLILSWTQPGQLQETSDLTSATVWTNVPGVVGMSHVIATRAAKQQAYYRLKINGYREIVPSGTSDDASVIQAALDQLQAGETLKLTGNFVIRRTLYLPSHFRWILNGSLSLGNNARDSLDRVGWVAPGIDARRYTGISEKPGGAGNIDMSGGTYNGNAISNASSLRFINFVSATNSYFHDMVITNVSDDNFTLGPGSKSNVCRNLVSSFSITGNALTDKGDHNRWFDCIAEDCLGDDGDGWTPKCRYSEFYRCIARRNGGPGFGMFCRTDGSGNPVDLGEAIDGNKFFACQSYENEGCGFSFNISSTSGQGGSIRSNYVQAICYNNRESGVRFRNKMPNSVVADNELNILCWGNQSLNADGTAVSTLAGGLGTDGGTYPITGITGTMVSFDNVLYDVNTAQASNCNLTVYRPAGKNAPKLKIGDASNSITVIGFDCLDPLLEWCMQAYCNSISP
jgi:hypothetical protein